MVPMTDIPVERHAEHSAGQKTGHWPENQPPIWKQNQPPRSGIPTYHPAPHTARDVHRRERQVCPPLGPRFTLLKEIVPCPLPPTSALNPPNSPRRLLSPLRLSEFSSSVFPSTLPQMAPGSLQGIPRGQKLDTGQPQGMGAPIDSRLPAASLTCPEGRNLESGSLLGMGRAYHRGIPGPIFGDLPGFSRLPGASKAWAPPHRLRLPGSHFSPSTHLAEALRVLFWTPPPID